MSGTQFIPPRFIPVNGSGRPYPGAKLYFYEAGTTTLATVYTTSALAVESANPLTANASGMFDAVYLDPAAGYNYKAVLKNSAGSQLWSEDNIVVDTVTTSEVGLALYPRTAGEIAASVTPTAYQYPPHDVRRYGAVGDGTTNDAAAINTAANVIRHHIQTEKIDTTTSPPATLKFGGGLVYRVNSTIWLGTANTASGTYTAQHVRDIDLDGSTIVGYTDGTPIFDWCGGYEGAGIMRNGKIVGAATTTPLCGILLARTSEADEGGGANAQNADPRHFINVQVKGHFTLAAVYNYASELMKWWGGMIWNSYASGAPALIITNNNARYAANSPNVTLSDDAGGSITAAQSCIDFKFWGVDIQNKAAALGSYNSNSFQASCIELWGVQEALFDGCFINAPSVNNKNLCYSSENASVQPERIVFSNGSFHSDNGTGASIKCAGTHGSLTVINNRNVYNTLVDHSTGQITRLTVYGNDTKDTIVADTLIGAHLIIQDALTVTTNFSGYLQTTGSGTISLPAIASGTWVTHVGVKQSLGKSGTATLSSGTANVTFGTNEVSNDYQIVLSGNASETFRWSSKATTGFTITSSNGSSTASVDWAVVRG